MDNRPTLVEEFRVLRGAVPGALVFVAVMLLLRGYHGTVLAVRQQVLMFVQSFLGGEDSLVPLLLHTLPLAIASAVCAYSIAGRWIRLDNAGSFVVLAGIVLLGTSVGGVLQSLVVSPQGGKGHQTLVEMDESSPLLSSGPPRSDNLRSTIPIGSLRQRFARSQPMSATERRSVSERLSDIDLTAVPDLQQLAAADVVPVELLPRGTGIFGIVAIAVNQLLGYLVAWHPRVFFAAVLAGAWTGWQWQRRLASWKQAIGADADDHDVPVRQAA